MVGRAGWGAEGSFDVGRWFGLGTASAAQSGRIQRKVCCWGPQLRKSRFLGAQGKHLKFTGFQAAFFSIAVGGQQFGMGKERAKWVAAAGEVVFSC